MVRIVLGSALSPAQRADPALTRRLTQVRGSLARLLGNDACRHRLLGGSIRWDRLLLAFDGDRLLGFAAFKHARRGPFALNWRPFVLQFGAWQGWPRFIGFCLSEWREWRYPFLLYGLRVDKAARNRGVGSALVQACCAHAEQVGAAAVDLEVPLDNLRAQRLYRHNGFTALGRRWLTLPPMRGMRRRLPATVRSTGPAT